MSKRRIFACQIALNPGRLYKRSPLSRKEFPITETELKLIAAAAITGLSRSPVKG
jgi:hypothetical protein